MYQIERAIFDIRRGLPVVVNAGEQRLLVQALEGSESVEALALLAGDRPSLVLTRHRLAAMGMNLSAEAASLPLAAHISTNELHGLATAETLSQPAGGLLSELNPAGIAELGAVTLMRRALLIPAALCAFVSEEATAAIEQQLAEGRLLQVSAEDATQCLAGRRVCSSG